MNRRRPKHLLDGLLDLRLRRTLVLVLSCWSGAACVSSAHSKALEARRAPYVLVLGTAQDGGLPQIGCADALCRRARREPSFARCVTSLLVADPRSGARVLLDATPDVARQMEAATGHPPMRYQLATRDQPGARPALVDAVFLTHAHMGHYTGLAWFGREVYGARDLRVHATERMAAFLRANDPWRRMVDEGTLSLAGLEAPVEIGAELRIEALPVPHRDEFSDTVAFLVQGPSRRLLYLPDIDKWERWELSIEELLRTVDVALLDGTFFDGDELPGRDMDSIPHPFVSATLERFATLPAAERAKVVFTHLNHSNPLVDPDSAASRAVRAAGMAVARDGAIYEL